MGIKGLFLECPGGTAADRIDGFSNLSHLKNKANPADLDNGTLLYTCALIHHVEYNTGNYIPAVREFKRQVVFMTAIHKWDFTMIFDGCPPPEKAHEHKRRKDKEGGIIITSTYIAMCVEVCKDSGVPYIVAPAEADMQVCSRNPSAIAICFDADEIAYGCKRVLAVDSYFKEKCRDIDLTVKVTPAIAANFPVYAARHKFGLHIFHWFAAVVGCDLSEDKNGIKGSGRGAFVKALQHVESIAIVPSDLTANRFAKILRDNSREETRMTYSVKQIEDEFNRISEWFTRGGTYYDKDGNVHSRSGNMITIGDRITKQHMRGQLDPKTRRPFTDDQKQRIKSVQSHNLLHNSEADRSKLNHLSLPPNRNSIDECSLKEVKQILSQRGGSATGRDGKALKSADAKKYARAYLQLERLHPDHTVFYDRTAKENGLFAKIDVSERRTVTQIVSDLVNCGEFEPALHRFFVDVQGLLATGHFVEDFNDIAMTAPEMTDDFIHKSFVHVGESTSQKNINDGLTKVLDMDKIIYHAVARAPDGKSIYILSKQVASMKHDEKTRTKTDPGEKPKRSEYLVLVQILIEPTTIDSHGHTLGICIRIMRSYCAACKAGCGLCYHRAGLCWMQQLHWGEDRPTPLPATSGFCSWFPGSQGPRSCSVIAPIVETNILQLPKSNEEAKLRLERGTKKNVNKGIGAKFDIYSGDEEKWATFKTSEYSSASRIESLFQALKEAQLEDGDSSNSE